jgi:hypothetical protein
VKSNIKKVAPKVNFKQKRSDEPEPEHLPHPFAQTPKPIESYVPPERKIYHPMPEQ